MNYNDLATKRQKRIPGREANMSRGPLMGKSTVCWAKERKPENLKLREEKRKVSEIGE